MTEEQMHALMSGVGDKAIMAVEGLLTGKKRLVIKSKAYHVSGSDLIDYKHTFIVEDTDGPN